MPMAKHKHVSRKARKMAKARASQRTPHAKPPRNKASSSQPRHPHKKTAFCREVRSLLRTEPHFPMDARFTGNPTHLRALLQPEVYKSLALSRYVPQRPKLDAEGQPYASFGHQIRLLPPPDISFITSSTWGVAMAAAGRSANIHYENPLLRNPLIHRPQTTFLLRQDWAEASASFAALGPPTPRTLAILWNGVKTVMETRVLRAETWGCPHILDACKQQLSDLATLEEQSLKFLQHMPQYNIQYPHTISQLTIATLFLPFWSEHILDLGRLSEQETNTWAWGMAHQTWPNYIQPLLP